MTRDQIKLKILTSKLIAIIRLDDPSNLYPIACAIADGGITSIEITMTTPNALIEIKKLSARPDILVGVGSVVDSDIAVAAVEAGAQYVVTPVTMKEIIDITHGMGKPIISGALTPTEIVQAYDWGADVIKLFPAGQFGISYLKALKAPLPHIPIIPTGGINVDNAQMWLKAGAVALGIGGGLINQKIVADQNYKAITEMAKALVLAVK
ncbi:MAG: bifunctional 4-hydroxy-2-oxoglutarate aldolase/2-dehydro-3-deoxy-phosphogluconate aldolase [Saprospiraceae bacterium]